MSNGTALKYRESMAAELRDVEQQLGNLKGERDGLQEKIDALEAHRSELAGLIRHHEGAS